MEKTVKIILLILIATAGLAAIQSRIIGVLAQIDPVAFMGPNAAFGIVFPQEQLEKEFYITASQEYPDPIPYRLTTQVKPKPGASSEYCLVNPSDYDNCYPLLCPYVDVLSIEDEGDDKNGANLNSPSDTTDYWKIALDVPVINGYIGQDFEGVPVDSAGEYGCDIKLVIMGSGNDPSVKAKWEMNSEKDQAGKYLGTDDSADSGAQFNPSGQYQAPKRIAVCAIATDPDGVADIDAVYAGIFYPTDANLGPNGQGCGSLKQEIEMSQLSKTDGIELFCNKIRNNNNNLPELNEGYNYDEICSQDGELMEETAYVYCGEQELSYEDPSGDWRTAVLAQDNDGLSGILENFFEYLPLTAFEADFTLVSYGKAKLNTKKNVGGDSVFGTQDSPSVRNVGNTRLNIGVLQDDMGFGREGNSGNWHVSYDARVGSDAEFTDYDPETIATLNNPLNLSEIDAMDFSVKVSKFKEGKDDYIGNMILSAENTPHFICQ